MGLFKWFRSRQNIAAVTSKGDSYNVDPSHPAYTEIEQAVRDGDETEFVKLADVPSAIGDYTSGAIRISGERVFFGTHEIKNSLTERIIDAMRKGIPFTPFINFLNNLVQNPSKRALQEMYSWLEHNDIPITVDGFWLGYKRVDGNYLDLHTHTVDNHVGQKPEMPRSMVDDDWGTACSQGFHVGSMSYVQTFGNSPGNKCLIVKVNPKDVVSVPGGETNKCRVDRYEVIADYEKTLNWPVYEATGPGKPIRPVAGIVRDRPKPQVNPVSDVKIDDQRVDEEDRDVKYQWNVVVTLKMKTTEAITTEISDKLGSDGVDSDPEVKHKGSHDVLTWGPFEEESDADQFASDVGELPYVLDVQTRMLNEDGDRVVEGAEDADPHALEHLSTQQRYELRQRAIEVLMSQQETPNRHHAEIKAEAMTRMQMAELLPTDEQERYTDVDYEPEVTDLFPISFDVYDGALHVGHHNVRTESEETMIMEMAKIIYPLCEQKNREDKRPGRPAKDVHLVVTLPTGATDEQVQQVVAIVGHSEDDINRGHSDGVRLEFSVAADEINDVENKLDALDIVTGYDTDPEDDEEDDEQK